MSATITSTTRPSVGRQRPALAIPKHSASIASGSRSYHSNGDQVREKVVQQDGKGKGKARMEPQKARDPWTLSLPGLERFVSSRDERRVIFILGDPSMSAIQPLCAAPSLAGCLVLLASLSTGPAQTQILHPMPFSHPMIRTLKLDPKQAQEPDAVRVMHLLERGEKVARAWRASQQNPYQSSNDTKEMDSLSQVSSPGTPPTPAASRPVSPTSSFSFPFSRIRRTSSILSPQASSQPFSPIKIQERAFDAVFIFLPATPFSSAQTEWSSDFELRAHAAHAHLKLGILVTTLSAPFLVSRRAIAGQRASYDHAGADRADYLRHNSEPLSTILIGSDRPTNERKNILGFLQPRLRKLPVFSSSHSSPTRRISPLPMTSSSSLPNSIAFAVPLIPAHLVHILPPGLDKNTQATLARSLDGFLSSFHPAHDSRHSAPDSPGAIAIQTIHTCFIPLGSLSDPLTLPVGHTSMSLSFSPLELILSNCLTPPSPRAGARPTRWLPSVHPPNVKIVESTLSPIASPPSTAVSTASTESSLQLSPSHPLSKLDIPIRSHVFHSRADSMGKHRPGHRDRAGVLFGSTLPLPSLPTPPESESSEEGGEYVMVPRTPPEGSPMTPGSDGSVQTVKKKHWGRHY